MIDVSNLTKYFGPVVAVDNISFHVAKGEIVGFLGPNGAGKTTTMRILTTFLPASSGIARVVGFDVMTQSMDARKNIGYLPENVPLYPEMRVEEYLSYRAQLKGVARAERKSRIDNCVERCRIKEVRRRLCGTLSKGYRQRVGLADAMIGNPPLFILDEPTSGLDPLQIRETLAMIKSLGETHTILLSTHILSEVEAICGRVIIINSGRIGLDKPMSQLEHDAIIVIEVRGPADQVTGTIKSVEGVTGVRPLPVEGDRRDGVCGFEVRTHNNQDLRETIAQRVGKGGWVLRKLDLRRRRLEERFMEVMREQDPLKTK